MLSENLASIASLRRLAGDDAQALELSLEGYRISEEIGNPWGQAYALMNAYGVYLDRGELGKTIAAMEESIALAERAGFIPPQASTRSDLAFVYAYLGDRERANEVMAVALRVANEQPITRPWVMGAKAELHLLAGELGESRSAALQSQVDLLPEPLRSGASIRVAIVQARIDAAEGDHRSAARIATEVLERLRGLGVRQFVPQALLVQGTALAAMGRGADSERVLREARSEAEALGCRRVLWEILRELSRVLASSGDPTEAAGARAEAARLVRQIAESIDDPRLRTSFLGRPDVHAVASG
jgi:tetratricopeptide (TPR) repeat protein